MKYIVIYMDTFSDFMNYLDRNSDSMKKDLK